MLDLFCYFYTQNVTSLRAKVTRKVTLKNRIILTQFELIFSFVTLLLQKMISKISPTHMRTHVRVRARVCIYINTSIFPSNKVTK